MVRQFSKHSNQSQRAAPSGRLKVFVSEEKAVLAVNFLLMNIDFFAEHLKKANEDGSQSYGLYLDESLDTICGSTVAPVWQDALAELGRQAGSSGEGFVDFYEAMLGDGQAKKGLVDRDPSAMLALLRRSPCLFGAVSSCATGYNRSIIESRYFSAEGVKKVILQAKRDVDILKGYGAGEAVAKLEEGIDHLKTLSSKQSSVFKRSIKEVRAFFPYYNSMLAVRSQEEAKEINKRIVEIRSKALALRSRRFDKALCGKAAEELDRLASGLEEKSKGHHSRPFADQLRGRKQFFDDCEKLIGSAQANSDLSSPRMGLAKFYFQLKKSFVSLRNKLLRSSHKAKAPKTASLKLVGRTKGLFENSNTLFAGSPFAHTARKNRARASLPVRHI